MKQLAQTIRPLAEKNVRPMFTAVAQRVFEAGEGRFALARTPADLLAQLKQFGEFDRVLALDALKRSPDKESRRVALLMTEDENAGVAKSAVLVCGQLAGSAQALNEKKEFLEALAKASESGISEIREATAQAMAWVGAEGLELLKKLSRDAEDEVRKQVATSCSAIKTRESLELLKAMKNDSVEEVRQLAGRLATRLEKELR
ncbi:HEAT repeat domain-containing protein [Candidatus Micrarchaeota archaeon]|nr:HEAT repeat domain-containing protein [Candidatus Micrarchaeota archaeon]